MFQKSPAGPDLVSGMGDVMQESYRQVPREYQFLLPAKAPEHRRVYSGQATFQV